MFRLFWGMFEKFATHDDIVARTAVFPSVVGQRLIPVVDVEDVEILACQARSLALRLRRRGDQIAIHLHDPLKLGSSTRLKSTLVGMLNPKARVSSIS